MRALCVVAANSCAVLSATWGDFDLHALTLSLFFPSFFPSFFPPFFQMPLPRTKKEIKALWARLSKVMKPGNETEACLFHRAVCEHMKTFFNEGDDAQKEVRGLELFLSLFKDIENQLAKLTSIPTTSASPTVTYATDTQSTPVTIAPPTVTYAQHPPSTPPTTPVKHVTFNFVTYDNKLVWKECLDVRPGNTLAELLSHKVTNWSELQFSHNLDRPGNDVAADKTLFQGPPDMQLTCRIRPIDTMAMIQN